jgi:hypothetical protein
MTGGLCGRADLVKAMTAGGASAMGIMARLLGYVPSKRGMTIPSALEAGPPRAREVAVQAVQDQSQPLADVPFWRLECHEGLEADGRPRVLRSRP